MSFLAFPFLFKDTQNKDCERNTKPIVKKMQSIKWVSFFSLDICFLCLCLCLCLCNFRNRSGKAPTHWGLEFKDFSSLAMADAKARHLVKPLICLIMYDFFCPFRFVLLFVYVRFCSELKIPIFLCAILFGFDIYGLKIVTFLFFISLHVCFVGSNYCLFHAFRSIRFCELW